VVLLGDSTRAMFRGYGNDWCIQDVKVHCYPGKVFMAGPYGLTVDNLDVVPATSGRKLSSVRDALSGNVTGTVVIQNCNLDYCGDDAIQLGPRPTGRIDGPSVDTVNNQFLVDPADAAKPLWWMAKDSTVEVRSSDWSHASRQTATLSSHASFESTQLRITYGPPYGISETAFEAALADDNLVFPFSYMADSILVQDSTIRFARGEGIKLRSPNVTITHCTIKKTSTAGIILGGGTVERYPLASVVYPANFAEVSYCTLVNAGPRGWKTPSMNGSIMVAVVDHLAGPSGDTWVYPSSNSVTQDVHIHHNVIKNYERGGVFCDSVGGATGIVLNDNTFENLGDPTASAGHPYRYGSFFQDCATSSSSGNTYINCVEDHGSF